MYWLLSQNAASGERCRRSWYVRLHAVGRQVAAFVVSAPPTQAGSLLATTTIFIKSEHTRTTTKLTPERLSCSIYAWPRPGMPSLLVVRCVRAQALLRAAPRCGSMFRMRRIVYFIFIGQVPTSTILFPTCTQKPCVGMALPWRRRNLKTRTQNMHPQGLRE